MNNKNINGGATPRSKVAKTMLFSFATLGMGLALVTAGGDTVEASEWTANTPESIMIKQGDTSYTMVEGDTLWAIGMKINVNVETLAKANNIDLASGQHYSLAIGTVIKWGDGKLEAVNSNGETVSNPIELNDSNKIVKDKAIGEDVSNDVSDGTVKPNDVVGNPNNTGGNGSNGGTSNGTDNGNGGNTSKPTNPEKPTEPTKPETPSEDEVDSKTPIGQLGLHKTEEDAIDFGVKTAKDLKEKTGKDYLIETWEVLSTTGKSLGWSGKLTEKESGEQPVLKVTVPVTYKTTDGETLGIDKLEFDSGSTQEFKAKSFDGYEVVKPSTQTHVVQEGLSVIFEYKKVEDAKPTDPTNTDKEVIINVDVDGNKLDSTDGYHFVSESTDGGVVKVINEKGDTETTYTTTRVWEKDTYKPVNTDKYVTVNVDESGKVLSSTNGYHTVSTSTDNGVVKVINDKGDTETTYTTTVVWAKDQSSGVHPLDPIGNSGVLVDTLGEAEAEATRIWHDPNSEFYIDNPVNGDWSKGYAWKTLVINMSDGSFKYSVEFYVTDVM